MKVVLCWPSIPGHEVYPLLIYAVIIHWRRKFSFSQKVSIAKNFLIGIGLCVYFSLWLLWFCLCRFCDCCHKLSEFICVLVLHGLPRKIMGTLCLDPEAKSCKMKGAWEGRLLQAVCRKTKGKSEKIRMEDRNKSGKMDILYLSKSFEIGTIVLCYVILELERL